MFPAVMVSNLCDLLDHAPDVPARMMLQISRVSLIALLLLGLPELLQLICLLQSHPAGHPNKARNINDTARLKQEIGIEPKNSFQIVSQTALDLTCSVPLYLSRRDLLAFTFNSFISLNTGFPWKTNPKGCYG